MGSALSVIRPVRKSSGSYNTHFGVRRSFMSDVFSQSSHGWVGVSSLSVLLFLSAFLFPAVSSAQIASGQAKFLGSEASPPIPSDFSLFWNQITPGNEGKWGTVAGTSSDTSKWNWTGLTEVYDYAMQNGMQFKEHNLVWGQQQPSWISSLDSAQQYQEVKDWIMLCAEHCPKASMVDVVNEPLEDLPNGLNPVPYYKALGGAGSTGWDWVITAFKLAREYFPNAKLLVNDYFILGSDPTDPSSPVYRYRALIDTLKTRNLIDGIGCEAHFLEGVDSSRIRTNLNILAATGLPIYISEYTVNESSDSQQLGIYMTQFPVFWTDPDVKGITLWGYIQGEVWNQTPDCYLISSNGTERPALQWLVTYVQDHPAGIEKLESHLPTKFTLGQNYPNPFNPTTNIGFRISNVGLATLKVYDVLGRRVATLVDKVEQPGKYEVKFNGSWLASGVYFYRLQSGSTFLQKKMVLIK